MTGRGQAAARVRGESRGRVHQEGGGWPLSGHGHAGASGPGPDVLPLVKCPSALAEGRLSPSATGRVQLEPNLGIPPVFRGGPPERGREPSAHLPAASRSLLGCPRFSAHAASPSPTPRQVLTLPPALQTHGHDLTVW